MNIQEQYKSYFELKQAQKDKKKKEAEMLLNRINKHYGERRNAKSTNSL